MGNQLSLSEDGTIYSPQDFYNFAEFVLALKQGLVTPRNKKGAKAAIGSSDRARLAQIVKEARDRYFAGILDFYEKSEAFYNALIQVKF